MPVKLDKSDYLVAFRTLHEIAVDTNTTSTDAVHLKAASRIVAAIIVAHQIGIKEA
jgi:hypothetical protein